MGVEDVIKEVTTELERMVSAKTVIGDPVVAGGKTIIPIPNKSDATVRSMIKNGIYIRNPYMNAVFNSLIMNAGARI